MVQLSNVSYRITTYILVTGGLCCLLVGKGIRGTLERWGLVGRRRTPGAGPGRLILVLSDSWPTPV